MGTILAQTIVDRAEQALNDSTNTRFSAAELLDYLNEAQRQIVSVKHDAYIKQASMALVAGTGQTIPSDGVGIIDVVRNMGQSPGATPGKSIRYVELDFLNEFLPDWHASTASATVKHWTRIPTELKAFYVYPPQPASGVGYVHLVYSATPPDVALGSAISLDDIHSNTIFYLIVARAFAKEISAQDLAKADRYFAMAMQSLGVLQSQDSRLKKKE